MLLRLRRPRDQYQTYISNLHNYYTGDFLHAGRRRTVPVRLRSSRLDNHKMDRFFRSHFRSVHQVQYHHTVRTLHSESVLCNIVYDTL